MGRRAIQFSRCQVEFGVAHPRGGAVKLEYPTGGVRCWAEGRAGCSGSQGSHNGRYLQGVFTSRGRGERSPPRNKHSSSQKVAEKQENVGSLKCWQLSSWKEAVDTKVRCCRTREKGQG